MSDKTTNNLFIVSSMPRLYQRLLSGVASHSELGNRIIREIKAAHAVRQIDAVRELAGILINNPIKEFQLIGQYYLIWCQCRERKYDTEALDRIIDQTRTYKTKALISRAAFEGYRGNTENEFYFYAEALKSSPDISDYVNISRAIAVVKSKEGFHQSAMRDLEKLTLLIKHVEPLVYFDYLNSLAVELSEANRKNEARNIIKHVLASPFAKVYPEWRSTADDLKPANRSFAVLRPTRIRKGKLLHMPPREHGETTWSDTAAPIVSLAERREQMAKDNDKPKLEDMTESEIMMEIIRTISSLDFSYEQRLKVLETVRKVTAEPPKPDDED